MDTHIQPPDPAQNGQPFDGSLPPADANSGPGELAATPAPKAQAEPEKAPEQTAGAETAEDTPLEEASAPKTTRMTIEDALPILEARVKLAGVSPDQLFERIRLDGCVATDIMEVFNIANVYFGTGKLYDDGKPRHLVAIGLEKPFELDSVWAHVAYQLGRPELEAAGAKEYVDKYMSDRIGAETPRRGAEAFHLSIWISPIEVVRQGGQGQEFLDSVAKLIDELDVVNENYGATFSIFCPLPERVLPPHIHDIIVSHSH